VGEDADVDVLDEVDSLELAASDPDELFGVVNVADSSAKAAVRDSASITAWHVEPSTPRELEEPSSERTWSSP
jgi:hypothetical protein